ERPDVVRRRAEVGPEPVAATEILVGGMDGLGPAVELSDAAHGPGVPRPGHPPDGPRLPVQVLAPHAQMPGDRRVGPAAVAARLRGLIGRVGVFVEILAFGPNVGIPTIGGFRRVAGALAEVGEASGVGPGAPELLERVGLAHELAERLAALAV